jgi:hypothetical protein
MHRQFSTRIAGIYYHRGHVGGLHAGQLLPLVREPRNPHDGNAVAVYMPDSVQLGYIPRDLAISLAREMDAGLTAYAVVQWTRERYDTPRRGWRSRRHRRESGKDHLPPECYVTVIVGDGRIVTSSPTARRETPKPSAPSVAQRPSGQCFVATAVFGDAQHPTVVALRKWRDVSLRKRPVGRTIIRLYNMLGPFAARVISAMPCSRRCIQPLLSVFAHVTNRRIRAERT